MSHALIDLTLAQSSAAIGSGELSPVELTNAYLAHIEAVDDKLHAFVRLTADAARADAARAECEIRQDGVRGPLHGVPLALKDLFDTAGVPTTGNSRAYLNRVPESDAFVVARLREAGAVILGKLVMHELATGSPDRDGPFPPARNPWDLGRMPG